MRRKKLNDSKKRETPRHSEKTLETDRDKLLDVKSDHTRKRKKERTDKI